jgi:hypothetical protein
LCIENGEREKNRNEMNYLSLFWLNSWIGEERREARCKEKNPAQKYFFSFISLNAKLKQVKEL